MKEIDLYAEAKPRYYQLIPNRDDGLVILALYQKYNSSEFTEDQIIAVINKVIDDLYGAGLREESNRNNSIILRLQEFFLWRDRKRKRYGFKKYGEEFCLKILKRLSESYHPAKIERLFRGLLDTLKMSLELGSAELLVWIDDHFNQRSTELALQIEILDQQVSESVDQFRAEIKKPQANIMQVIDSISIGLDKIKQHAHELTRGFQITYDIDDLLQILLKDVANFGVIDEINTVLSYNQDVRNHLDQVSIRIDKIKPRIREFIFEFNQRELDRKTDKFINYLLDNVSYLRQENQSRKLVFPDPVPLLGFRYAESIPRFFIVTEKDFTTKSPILPVERTVDVERTKLMQEKSQQKIEARKRVLQWMNQALSIVEQHGKLSFSPFFFEILKAEANDLNIAVKVSQKLLKECNNRRKYLIDIDQNEYHDPNYLNLSLWNMTILKKV